jgi:hypothetical protein
MKKVVYILLFLFLATIVVSGFRQPRQTLRNVLDSLKEKIDSKHLETTTVYKETECSYGLCNYPDNKVCCPTDYVRTGCSYKFDAEAYPGKTFVFPTEPNCCGGYNVLAITAYCTKLV